MHTAYGILFGRDHDWVIDCASEFNNMREIREGFLPKHPYCLIIDWKHRRYKYHSADCELPWLPFRAENFTNKFVSQLITRRVDANPL